MGNNDFGELFKHIRNKKKLTLKNVEEITGVTTRHLYRIEMGEYVPAYSTLKALSEGLEVNLANYLYKNTDFGSYAEYEKYCVLRSYIINNNFQKLEEFLSYYPDQVTLDLKRNDFKRAIVSGKTLLLWNKKTSPKKVLSFLFSTFSDSQKNFDYDNIRKYITTDLSISTLLILETFLFNMKEFEKAEKILLTIIDFLEEKYANSYLEAFVSDKKYDNFYVTSLNNLSDLYYHTDEIEKALDFSTKVYNFIKKENYTFFLEVILKKFIFIHYKQNEIKLSKKYYNKLVAFCIFSEKERFLFEVNNCIKKDFPKLREHIILHDIEAVFKEKVNRQEIEIDISNCIESAFNLDGFDGSNEIINKHEEIEDDELLVNVEIEDDELIENIENVKSEDYDLDKYVQLINKNN